MKQIWSSWRLNLFSILCVELDSKTFLRYAFKWLFWGKGLAKIENFRLCLWQCTCSIDNWDTPGTSLPTKLNLLLWQPTNIFSCKREHSRLKIFFPSTARQLFLSTRTPDGRIWVNYWSLQGFCLVAVFIGKMPCMFLTKLWLLPGRLQVCRKRVLCHKNNHQRFTTNWSGSMFANFFFPRAKRYMWTICFSASNGPCRHCSSQDQKAANRQQLVQGRLAQWQPSNWVVRTRQPRLRLSEFLSSPNELLVMGLYMAARICVAFLMEDGGVADAAVPLIFMVGVSTKKKGVESFLTKSIGHCGLSWWLSQSQLPSTGGKRGRGERRWGAGLSFQKQFFRNHFLNTKN